jgi:hypothetical protein
MRLEPNGGGLMDDEPVLTSKGRVMAFGIYLIALNLTLIYIVIRIWPVYLAN